MTIDGSVLRPDSLVATSEGAEIAVRLAWYRSLPLSCVTRLEVSLDGTKIPRDRMQLELNGKRFGLEEFADASDEWWFIQDPGIVHVRAAPAVAEGQDVDVTVVLDQRIPYILVGPDMALPTSTTITKRLRAGSERKVRVQ